MVSLTQILRINSAAWVMMAEKITCLKRDAQNDLHFEMKIWKILIHPSIFFCLLPIPSKYQSLPQAPHKKKIEYSTKRRCSCCQRRKYQRWIPQTHQNKGKGKNTNHKGRGSNTRKGLIGKSLQTTAGQRLYWTVNLERGCNEVPAGGKYSRDLHLCSEPGCEKSHSMQNHK